MTSGQQPPDARTGDLAETYHETALDEPAMYRVIIHNDHYTAMDFVIEVLMRVFNKPAAEATKIMMDVHKRGHGACGVYTFDIAVTKVNRVHAMAKSRGYPLKSSYEKV